MEKFFNKFTPAVRKRIYDVMAAAAGAFTVLLPTLVQIGWIPASQQANVVSIITGVMSVAAFILARKNVTVPESAGTTGTAGGQ